MAADLRQIVVHQGSYAPVHGYAKSDCTYFLLQRFQDAKEPIFPQNELQAFRLFFSDGVFVRNNAHQMHSKKVEEPLHDDPILIKKSKHKK